jgi:hypothetical protein
VTTVIGCVMLSFLFQAASTGDADPASALASALDQFDHEPSCSEVVKKAVETAGKNKKNKLPSTKAIRASALLPLVRVSLTKNLEYDESLSLVQEEDAALKIYTDDDLKLKITLQWDLAALVFNPSEGQMAAKALSEAQWKLETTKAVVEIYHLRKKLMALLLIMGQGLPMETAVDWAMKVEELTALLDALTDDWFTREAEKRKAEETGKK